MLLITSLSGCVSRMLSAITCITGIFLVSASADFTCNDGYSCYEDATNENLVWITGPGTCSDMCSNGLTGDSDYLCKGNQPILADEASFNYVAEGLGIVCQNGPCWGSSTGSDMMWISTSGINRDCYYPTSATYGCDSAIGNANCFGTRFNLVCACETEENKQPTPSPTCDSVSATPFLPCNDGFTCWEDESEDVVWVIGGGIFNSCRNTCESALSQNTDFYVCKSDQNSHTSYAEFEPVSGGMGFACKTSAPCGWENTNNGAFWIDQTDTCERTCLPASDEVYDCHATVGNANCFGERYTQACPCNAKPLDEACEWPCPNHSAPIAKWSEDEEGDSCLERVNYWRKKACEDGWPECPPAGLPPAVECTACHQCANTQSEYDSVHGSHASFTRCGEMAQGSGGGRTCKDVIDAFVSEREQFGGLCKGHCGPIVESGCQTFHWGRTKDPNDAGFYHYTLNWGNCKKDECDAYCDSVDGADNACFLSGIDTPSCSVEDENGENNEDEDEPDEDEPDENEPDENELDENNEDENNEDENEPDENNEDESEPDESSFVVVTVSSQTTFEGVSEEDLTDENRDQFVQDTEEAIKSSCGADEVRVTSLDWIVQRRETTNKASSLVILFDIVRNVSCDEGGDCASALAEADAAAAALTEGLRESVGSGAFLNALNEISNLPMVADVTVDVSSLQFEEPSFAEVVWGEDETNNDENVSGVLQILQMILDLFQAILDLFTGNGQ